MSPAFARLAHKTRAPWLLWENVHGALWAERGEAFAEILRAFTGRRIEVPNGGWKSAGCVIGAKERYSVAWRLLDAQYTRVAGYERALPQQRKRIWLVGHRGDWRAPSQILVGRECEPPVPCPVRLPEHPASGDNAGSSNNPVSIAGNVIQRAPDNEYVKRQKGWRVGAAFTCIAKLPNCICAGGGVRRCTPTEYERLMGFPDNYTLVPGRNGKALGDYARMFMLGNSWPVNCARFVCERIGKHIRGTLEV